MRGELSTLLVDDFHADLKLLQEQIKMKYTTGGYFRRITQTFQLKSIAKVTGETLIN